MRGGRHVHQNAFPAAPVVLSRERLRKAPRAQAVVFNAGNANACNAERGLQDAEEMSRLAASVLGISSELVLAASTGVIGQLLPMDRVRSFLPQVRPTPDGGHAAAQAIMTTDRVPKEAAIALELGGKEVRIGAMTKGVGMIYPNMATMLCYLTTDAAVEHDFLKEAMRGAVNDSFNMTNVDGDMSTNDSAFLFASGTAGNVPLRAGMAEAETFTTALRYVTRYLAREMARDGEGATHLMIVHVTGAQSDADARRAARAVTGSPLWQCAVAGGDPNWGRVIAALGASGADFRHDDLRLAINGVTLVEGGRAADYDQAAAKAAMQPADIHLEISIGSGPHEATAWGCDLTHGYIDENTTYTR